MVRYITLCFVTAAFTATSVRVMWFFINWESKSIGIIWKQFRWTWWSILCIIFCDQRITCCHYREWIFVITKYILLSVRTRWFFTVHTAIIQRMGATERSLEFSIWVIGWNCVGSKHRGNWGVTDLFSVFKLGLRFFFLNNLLFLVGVGFKWHHLMVFWRFNSIILF